MHFTTHEYLFFFLAVFVAYWLMPLVLSAFRDKPIENLALVRRLRVYLLLIASFYFYATWNQWLALLVTGTATVDWILARGIDAAPTRKRAKLLAALSIAMNLGVLCTFKYMNFFLDSLFMALREAGVRSPSPVLNLIVPFGISFYTFEAISYTVDVYKGRLKAERDLPNFLLFILFFPHLVAGPIVRGRDFLRQVHRDKKWSWVRGQHGLQLIALGLFKKLAIADAMAIYSDRIWIPPGAEVATLGTGAVWMAVIAFTIRVYCDFSGYSDIALGCAHLLGYKLTVNFNLPYISANIAEFWRRWHISLSNWLRDYIFIPLGGSRGGFLFTSRNLLITFGLGGLWHGAEWGWVAWGLIHAVMLIVHRAFRGFAEGVWWLKRGLESPPGTVVRILVTLFFVTLSMVFAQGSLTKSLIVIERMFVPAKGLGLPMDQNRLWWTVYLMVAAHLLGALGIWAWVWKRLPGPVIGALCALTFVAAQVLSPDRTKAFVYFQF